MKSSRLFVDRPCGLESDRKTLVRVQFDFELEEGDAGVHPFRHKRPHLLFTQHKDSGDWEVMMVEHAEERPVASEEVLLCMCYRWVEEILGGTPRPPNTEVFDPAFVHALKTYDLTPVSYSALVRKAMSVVIAGS